MHSQTALYIQFRAMDDRQLVKLLVSGDADAWDFIFSAYVMPYCLLKRFAAVCFRYDIPVQALLTTVWTILQRDDFHRLKMFRFDSSLKTFLFFIIHESVKFNRREAKGTGKIIYLPPDSVPDVFPPVEPTCLQTEQERLASVNKCLATLWKANPEQAMALMLRVDMELPSKKIGAMLDRRPATVDTMIDRARTRIQQEHAKSTRKETAR